MLTVELCVEFVVSLGIQTNQESDVQCELTKNPIGLLFCLISVTDGAVNIIKQVIEFMLCIVIEIFL